MDKYERLVQDKKPEKTVFRVGAYCRVSTDKADQSNSFESQQRYFKEYIERNPAWELTEIFADEGKSGTSTNKRGAFKRMIACAKSGELDLIITKEISRFARNTLDSIYYTRELKRVGVGVIFLNDNINTLEPDAELRLTIMSSISQEESRRTSERVKWGQRRRMEQGIVFGRNMLGYDIRHGQMFINKEGAEIVRLIFHKFSNENKGACVIARELREAGIKSYSRKTEWSNTAILRIIRNEKYCGDLVQKKTFTPDYLTHEKKCNHGEEEFIVIKNHHEPIIPRELYEKANEILEHKSLSQEGKAKYSNRYAFSGKIKCGICDSSFVARHRKRKDGSLNKNWQCFGCASKRIRNADAAYIVGLVVQSLDIDKDLVSRNLLSAIEHVLTTDGSHVQAASPTATHSSLETQQARLIEIYMSGVITREEFVAARNKCDMEIEQLKAPTNNTEKQNVLMSCQQTLMSSIKDALHEMSYGICLDDTFHRNILNKMVVHNSDRAGRSANTELPAHTSLVEVYLNFLPHQWSYILN